MTLPVVPGEVRIGDGALPSGRRAGDPENSFTMPALYRGGCLCRLGQQAAAETYQLKLECKTCSTANTMLPAPVIYA